MGPRRDTTDWFESDESSFDQLATGHAWVERVAERLKEAGFDAKVTPIRRRATIDDRHEFRDEIDLVVGPRDAPFEVKSRALTFDEDPRSYPFDTAFVDTVSGWEAKDPKPVAVVLVSQRSSAMLVVPPSTKPSWKRIRKWDRVWRIDDEWYAVDRSQLLTFRGLLESMRKRWKVGDSPLRLRADNGQQSRHVQSEPDEQVEGN